MFEMDDFLGVGSGDDLAKVINQQIRLVNSNFKLGFEEGDFTNFDIQRQLEINYMLNAINSEGLKTKGVINPRALEYAKVLLDDDLYYTFLDGCLNEFENESLEERIDRIDKFLDADSNLHFGIGVDLNR